MQSSILNLTHDQRSALDGIADQLNNLSKITEITATDLATVMGTRLLAEQPSVAQLEEALRGATDLPHCQNKPAIYRQIAQHLHSSIEASLTRAADTAAATAADRLIAPVSSVANEANTSMANGQEILAELINRIGEVDTSTLPASRLEAINKFNSSLALVLETNKALTTHDKTSSTISTELKTLYANNDCKDHKVREEIQELQKLRSNIEKERSHEIKKLLQHFNENIHSSSEHPIKELKIPNNLDKGKGQELIERYSNRIKAFQAEYNTV